MSRLVLAVIPARLGSTRFPRKLLARHDGKTILEHVWCAVSRSPQIDRVIIAAEGKELIAAAKEFGAEVVPSSSRHKTGSDRVAEAARKISASLVVNVQGDNFGLSSAALNKLVLAMQANRDWPVGTLVRKAVSREDVANPSKVKVALAASRRALWFSRAPLPMMPSGDLDLKAPHWIHIGVYAFRPVVLRRFAQLKQTKLEQTESLEQLRLLESGIPVFTEIVANGPLAIDTPADLARLKRLNGQRMVR